MSLCWAALAGLAGVTAFADAPSAPPSLEEFGRKVFFDPRLSADGRTSCASCHRPEAAFQDGRPLAVGAWGRTGTRNTPSLIHVGSQKTLFWDGRSPTLEDQALEPLLHADEHGLASIDELARRMDALADYRAWRDQGTRGLQLALAAYQRTLADGENAFERFLFKADREAIPESAKRGWALFSGRAGCIECHHVGRVAPGLFTDHDFHGVVRIDRDGGKPAAELMMTYLALRAKGAEHGQAVLQEPELARLGRFVATRNPKDIGRFKTPSLRNVALTAPYMHDGSIASLAEAVDAEIYYRSKATGRPTILLDTEKSDIVSFLRTLTGDELAIQRSAP
jgi:cytochrome c peroxidase